MFTASCESQTLVFSDLRSQINFSCSTWGADSWQSSTWNDQHCTRGAVLTVEISRRGWNTFVACTAASNTFLWSAGSCLRWLIVHYSTKNRLRVVFLQHYNKYILFRQGTSSWHLIIMQTLFVSGCNTLITFIFKWESTTVALTFKGKVCTQWISFPSQLTHIYYVEELLWFQTQRKTKKHWVWTHCGWFTSPWTPLSSNVHSTMQHHLLSASVCGSSCIIDSEVLSCTGLSKVFAQLISSTDNFWHIADISVGCSRLYGTW